MDLNGKTVVFSKTICPYCVTAKEALAVRGVEYDDVQVNVDISKEEMQSLIQQRTGVLVDTVPQIFIDGDYIGGADDLLAHFENKDAEIDAGDLSEFNI